MPSDVRYAVVAKLLQSKGYTLDRVNGSHFIWTKPGAKHESIPVHRGMVKYGYYRNVQKL